MIRFIDVTKSRRREYRIDEKETFVFFLYNYSGRLRIQIRAAGAQVYIFGLFLGRRENLFRLQIFQEHLAPNTFSEALVKGVFSDESKFFYQGLIKIARSAQRSHAYQKNQNLLISKRGFVESRPSLEILADDVFCTHGSTTGRLNPESLFYLQSRGLTKKRAQNVLVQGFLQEIFEKMENLGHFTQLEKYKQGLAFSRSEKVNRYLTNA